ncbi:YciI family protein [Pseudomonas sp. P5_A2_2]
MQDIRYVVFHKPGPAWLPGKSMFEQPGVRDHVAHYRKWLDAGKLELGGPHLDTTGGGMMVPIAGVSEDEVTRFASEDPAVKSGTLLAEVRPWLIGMSK